jgi:carboxymethylenebutenolidase
MLPQVDRDKIAIMGVCQTGRHPLVFAAEHPVAAALVWYGAAGDKEWNANAQFPKPFEDVIAHVDCPVLGLFGEADHVISLSDVRRLRDSLDRHDKTYTIKVYPGAPHGWLNDTMPGRYRRDTAEAAWAFQLAFLKRVFDPSYDRSRRIQVYESDSAADYDFSKNVRLA